MQLLPILFCFLLARLSSASQKMLITKEQIEYLKKTASYEVMEYNENPFIKLTEEEADSMGMNYDEIMELQRNDAPTVEPYTGSLPDYINWGTSDCMHAPRNQGNCASGSAFSVAGTISDLCCLNCGDPGWMSPEELLCCDGQKGCGGGWPINQFNYMRGAAGIVDEACFPYLARTVPCPKKCSDGRDWKQSHKCRCAKFAQCIGVDNMRHCLEDGPMVAVMRLCGSFYHYKSGIYKCDCGDKKLHAVSLIGYSSTPDCHWIGRNSFGTDWGEAGMFRIGCGDCGIHGEWPNGNIDCQELIC